VAASAADVASRDSDAVSDLAADLRLRTFDLLGFEDGCAVAVQLALRRPELIRRVALVSAGAVDPASRITQSSQFLQFPADVFATNLAGVARAAGQFFNQK
jgi:pimeloyl-ACP methyl ester carboxylesterase